MTVHRDKFLIIKRTRFTNFSNLFLEWNYTCFGKFLCPSSRVFHCTHNNGICHTGLLTACEQDQDGTSWPCSQIVNKPVWHIPLLCVQWKIFDYGQRNFPKHVEFHSKNKFEKLVHLVGFIIRKATTIIRDRYPCPRRDSNSPVPACKRLQAHESGRAAMVIDPLFIRRFRKLKDSDYQLRHICLSVRLSVWNNSTPTGRIFMNFEYFSKICRGNSSFIKIW
jgi:hypothetical protein